MRKKTPKAEVPKNQKPPLRARAQGTDAIWKYIAKMHRERALFEGVPVRISVSGSSAFYRRVMEAESLLTSSTEARDWSTLESELRDLLVPAIELAREMYPMLPFNSPDPTDDELADFLHSFIKSLLSDEDGGSATGGSMGSGKKHAVPPLRPPPPPKR